MAARVSKSIKKLVQVKAELEKYAGDKLTNAELFKFANTLISLADEDFDDGIAREYSQSVNYYSREVDRMIGREAFTFSCMNSTIWRSLKMAVEFSTICPFSKRFTRIMDKQSGDLHG